MATQPRLTIPLEEARRKIEERIEIGRLLKLAILSEEYEAPWGEEKKWSDYNETLLITIFDNHSIAEEYSGAGGGKSVTHLMKKLNARTNMSQREQTEYIIEYLAEKMTALESILARLELYSSNIKEETATRFVELSNNVFVVHGTDEVAEQTVARFIEKLGLRAIILHEQPSGGKTIIEKIETQETVGYVVVLMTPDDTCHPKDDPSKQQPRPRQNVIFELGYFVGKLGREKVCALYGSGVEILTDYLGVVYVPFEGEWKLPLARELKQAGLPVDMNKVL